MTLVFQSPDASDGPRTHVLVIGVGRYPHLKDGSGPVLQRHFGLGQLTSPPHSAVAIADWFLGAPYRNPAAPLGSLELLVSPTFTRDPARYATPDGAEHEVEAATRPNIQRAFGEWYARCDGDEANVAILHFCGHGLRTHSLILLAEDFGAIAVQPWLGSWSFDLTYEAMAACKAKTQCYFVDACQEVSRETLPLQIDAQPLMPPDLSRMRQRDALRLFAAAPGELAFGQRGEVTLFTRALLRGLAGAGAEQVEDGSWAVTLDGLGQAVRAIVLRQNQTGGPIGSCTPDCWGDGNAPLHYLEGPPPVEVTVGCQPRQPLGIASLFMKNLLTERRYGPVSAHDEWITEVEAGSYAIGVELPPQRVHQVSRVLLPPFGRVALQVGP